MLTVGSAPDLLRLVAVPILGWAAWRDVASRRVPNRAWYPLVAVGVVALAWELLAGPAPDRLYALRVAVSLGFVVPLAYLFWRLGGFGGADAKALMALALCFPTYPTYFLPTVALPFRTTTLGVFSLTVLTNAVLVGLAYPLALAARNAVDGDWHPLMFLGHCVPVPSLATAHGRLFETTEGATRRGLDLDALRMYLRWRGTTLADLRAESERHRTGAVGRTYRPGDGAVDGDAGNPVTESERPTGGDADAPTAPEDDDASAPDDPWGAARFLAEIEGDAYGTTPETLREGLAVVTNRDAVWISPGIPFLVPTFVGLCVGLTYGDLLFGLLVAVGAA